MQKMLMFTALVALSAPVLAQSAIDGTWKADLKSVAMPKKPNVFLIKGGVYTCSSCVPPITVPADGKYHAVRGHPYFDMQAVSVLNANSVKVSQRKGAKVVGQSTDTVSADGKTMTYTFIDSNNPKGPPVTGKGTEQRVASGPAGAHRLSGSWIPTRYDSVSDAGLIVSFKTVGDMLHMNSPTGQSYSAKLGGTGALIQGDAAGTIASVRRVNASTFEETDSRGGKVVTITTMTVTPDGKTMETTEQDWVRGTKMSYKAHKQ